MVILPALQLSSGQLTSPAWSALTFAVLGVGIVLLVVVPWATGGWARDLLRSERRRDSNAVAAMVMLWDDTTPRELAVVVVDRNGVTFRGRSGFVQGWDWRHVSTLRLRESFSEGDHSISVVGTKGIDLARFVPLKPVGLYPQSLWGIDDLCRTLNEVRRRSVVA